MKFIRALLANTIFALNVLLVFLAIFRGELEVPIWLQPLGRMHPLLLHLPIGFLLLSVLLVGFRNSFKKKAFHNFLNFVLYFAALTAALTAIMGLLLSSEGGYDETQLELHFYAGVAVSLLSGGLLWLSLYSLKRKELFNIALVFNTIVLILAGHLGSVLTHGENFIFQPLSSDISDVVTDSTSLYQAAIQPILRSKCMSCHNDRKVKGNLSMSTPERIQKGGKNGPIWVAGDPEKSTIIKRIHLPEENDDHMPPAGKAQLSKSEMQLLYLWIQGGADLKAAWTKFNPADSLRKIAQEFIHQQQYQSQTHYPFSPASRDAIQRLNTPFCTVSPISADEPALKADFFLSQAFNHKTLEELTAVKDQLTILNLAKMPVTDADGKVIGQFKNLERLNLNQTEVTGKILLSLKDLTHLKSISLVGTPIDKKSIEQLVGMTSLKEVFVWNTKVTADDTVSLHEEFPGVVWNQGYASKETLKLTPPLLVNESFMLSEQELIHIKHNLPGTMIRYTLDGVDPDSLTGVVYQTPIPISKYTILKSRAFKEGWYSSPVVQFYFFKKGVKPTSAVVLNPPDKDYKGEGAATLIDAKKGSADNFRDIAWLGYHDKPLVAEFAMDPLSNIESVTLSYGENFGSYLLPPASIELWAGKDANHLGLIQRLIPQQPAQNATQAVKGIVFKIKSGYLFFKLIVAPVPRVPVWISKKPDKGWVFVDEVIFN